MEFLKQKQNATHIKLKKVISSGNKVKKNVINVL